MFPSDQWASGKLSCLRLVWRVEKSMSSVSIRRSNYLFRPRSEWTLNLAHWVQSLNLILSADWETRKRSNVTGQMLGIRFDSFNCLVLFRHSSLSTAFVRFNKRMVQKRFRRSETHKNINIWKAGNQAQRGIWGYLSVFIFTAEQRIYNAGRKYS